MDADTQPINNPVFCSFCGKDQTQVRAIVSGPSVYLCSECWELAADIMADELCISAGVLYSYLKSVRLENVKAYLNQMADGITAQGGPVVIGQQK